MDFNDFVSEFFIAMVVSYALIVIFKGIMGSSVPFFTPNKKT